jgi:hypothetical protein
MHAHIHTRLCVHYIHTHVSVVSVCANCARLLTRYKCAQARSAHKPLHIALALAYADTHMHMHSYLAQIHSQKEARVALTDIYARYLSTFTCTRTRTRVYLSVHMLQSLRITIVFTTPRSHLSRVAYLYAQQLYMRMHMYIQRHIFIASSCTQL